MKEHIKINRSFEFTKDSSIRLNGKKLCDYKSIPACKGVYIFHIGSIDKVWSNKKNILYIGAANRESLRSRIRKNSIAKIINPSIKIKVPSKPIYVTYCTLDKDVPDYLPFLIEGWLLNKYEKTFKSLPEANFGRR